MTQSAFDLDTVVKKMVEAREAYYNTGHPIMTDQEYDALEERVRQSDPDHPILEKIGHTPSSAWPKVEHQIAMGSLEKVHTKEDFLKWANKFPDHSMTMQLKLDGLSISLNYENEKFIQGITRGDNTLGEDISPNIMLMKDFKPILRNFTGSLRAEIMLSRENFNKINSSLSEKDQYVNPRNAAAGISRGLDGMYCKYLNLTYYDISEPLDENKKLDRITELGLPVPLSFTGTANYIIEQFEAFKDKRSSLSFDIDGMVVKICDKYVQKTLGSIKGKPRAQKAWKFEPPGMATTLIGVTWEIGRTGIITPLGHVDPVKIEGSTIKKVTLHNIAEIKRLGIGIGDTVMLVKAGEIIPKITSVIEHKNVLIPIPDKCPSCGGPLTNDEIRLMCPSDSCPKKNLTRVLNWITVTEIDQFGEALAEELNQQEKLNCIADIYNLQKEDISTIEGWGGPSADKIIENINKTRTLAPEKFLTAVGIPGISFSTSEELLKQYGSVPALFNITADELKSVKGFSDISSASVVAGLKKYENEIQNLLKIITLETGKKKTEGVLSGKSFCFTGEMSLPRSQFQAMVIEHGGKSSSSVTKDLSFLVCNENKGSSKSVKAEKYNVKIINESQFLGMIGGEKTKTPDPKIETFSLFEQEIA
jgi:DNA ligase (NAD+)